MKLPRNARIFQGQLDVAPFAGVFFLLLMFTVFQSALVYTPGVRIDLPLFSEPMPGTTNRTVTVAVDASGRLYFGSQFITSTALLRRLQALAAEANEPLALVVYADGEVDWQRIASVLDLGQTAGFSETILRTRQPNL